MLVADVMNEKLTTVTPQTTLPEAMRLMTERGIRHLPVVDSGVLTGIVSDRDLKRAMASPATSLSAQELTYLLDKLRIGEIMTRAVITIAPGFPVEEAARIMIEEKISALPVTEAGLLVGIITETDVLDLFVRAMGAGEPSTRLAVVQGEWGSSLAKIVTAIEAAGALVAGVVTLVNRRGLKEAIVRVRTINPGAAVDALRARGYEVRDADRPGCVARR
jgi:acetoin utilization protein AcuB